MKRFLSSTLIFVIVFLPFLTFVTVQGQDGVERYGWVFTHSADETAHETIDFTLSVWTNKYTYQVGETVDIYISISANCTAQYTIIMPDGSREVYGPFSLEAGVYHNAGIASYPTGRRTVILEAWVGGEYATATTYYEVIPPPYTVTIRIEGLPSTFSATVYVDGAARDRIAGGRSKAFRFEAGTSHTISVDQSIDAGQGKRYYCQFNSQTFSSDASHTFMCVTQYCLTINSVHGGTVGEGWYDSGSSAPFSASSAVRGGTGIQYVFTGWSGDYEGKEPSASITMDSPHTVTANWKTQYYLKVASDHGNPQGEGWYDAGSMATFSVTSPLGMGAQYVFDRWTEDSPSTIATASILMDGPKTVRAVWRVDYTQIIIGASLVGSITVAVAVVVYTVVGRKLRAKRVEIPPQTLDDRVYNYVADHGGIVSIPKMSQELRATMQELDASFERLITTGKLERRENVASLSPEPSTDKEYIAIARALVRLEELRSLKEIDEETYQKLKEEYEERLKRLR